MMGATLVGQYFAGQHVFPECMFMPLEIHGSRGTGTWSVLALRVLVCPGSCTLPCRRETDSARQDDQILKGPLADGRRDGQGAPCADTLCPASPTRSRYGRQGICSGRANRLASSGTARPGNTICSPAGAEVRPRSDQYLVWGLSTAGYSCPQLPVFSRM